MKMRSNPTRMSGAQPHPQESWAYFVIFVSAVTIFIVLQNVPAALRAVVVFGFLLFVPGWSFIRLLRLSNPIAEWTLAIALSIAIDTLVAMLLLYAHAWSAQTGILVIVGISLIGSLLRIKDGPPNKRLEEETTAFEAHSTGGKRGSNHKPVGGREL